MPNCSIFSLNEFETDEVRAIKHTRINNEYTWTFKPIILQHALNEFPDLDWAVYLDGDLMAFGDPDAALVDAKDANVIITPHRSEDRKFLQEIQVAGSCNAGYVAFRNSEIGLQALQWWCERCIERCPSPPTNGIYADQTYLDRMNHLFSGMLHSSHKGLNAGPWNIADVTVSTKNDALKLDNDDLLLYHFQGLHIHWARVFDLYPGHIKISPNVSRNIYRPYIHQITRSFQMIRTIEPDFVAGIQPLLTVPRLLVNKLKRIVQGLNNMAATIFISDNQNYSK